MRSEDTEKQARIASSFWLKYQLALHLKPDSHLECAFTLQCVECGTWFGSDTDPEEVVEDAHRGGFDVQGGFVVCNRHRRA